MAKPKKRNPRKWAATNWGSFVGFGLAVLAALPSCFTYDKLNPMYGGHIDQEPTAG